MKMRDEDLFESELLNFDTGKSKKTKYLLKSKYQKKALKLALKAGRKIKKKSGVERVWVEGSIVEKRLGKYAKKWNEREYSDVDLFVLLTDSLQINSNNNLLRLGLIKKLNKTKVKNKVTKYYRISVADRKRRPLKIFDRFSVDVWLMTPVSYKKDIKRFPPLLHGAIEIR